MPVLIPIAKWLASRVFLIVALIILVVSSFFLKEITSKWIQEQRNRADESRARLEELKRSASEGVRRADVEVKRRREDVNALAGEITSTLEAIEGLNDGWRWAGSWTPGVGLKRDEYENQKAEAYRRKSELEKQKAWAEEKLKDIEKAAAELLNNDPNAGAIRLAEATYEREFVQLESRQRFVSDTERNLHIAWLKSRSTLVTFVAVILFGPMCWKLFCYWIVGGLVGKLKPIIFNPSELFLPPQVGRSTPALAVELEPGEELVLKEEFLQASLGDVNKSTEYCWNWRYPVLSVLAGLVFLTRVRAGTDGGRITLSSQEDPILELARVDLSEGQELVFRPGFLVGYSFKDSRPVIRAPFRFFSLQSWLTFRFRYFFVKGPVTMYFSAGRGFQVETVTRGRKKGLVVDRDIPALFTPELNFKARRAETFWSYAFGKNSLFDDYFEGDGVVLCQQVRGQESGMNPERIWGRLLGGIGKVIGL